MLQSRTNPSFGESKRGGTLNLLLVPAWFYAIDIRYTSKGLKLFTYKVASYEHTGARSSGTSKMVICAIGMSEILSGYAMATKFGVWKHLFLGMIWYNWLFKWAEREGRKNERVHWIGELSRLKATPSIWCPSKKLWPLPWKQSLPNHRSATPSHESPS